MREFPPPPPYLALPPTTRHNYSRWQRPGNLKTIRSVFEICLFQIQTPSFGKIGNKVYCKKYVLWLKLFSCFGGFL